MGFVRDMVIAQFFGAGAAVDAYLVAFKIPSFMRRLFAEGAFSQAFVPVLSEYRETRSHEEVRTFINHMSGLLGSVLLVITLIAILASPLIVFIFAPGFEKGSVRFMLSAHMLRITFPYLLCISLAALSAAILNSYGSFGVPAFTPVLLNISLILCAIFLAPYFHYPVEALAWGVFIAGFVQLGFQLPFLAKKKLMPWPKLRFNDVGVNRVLKLMVPAIFGVSVAQINILIDTIFASFLPIGSVSWLYYSDRLSQFPLGVFGVAIATVILPHLSRKHAAKSNQDFSNTLDWALRLIIFIGVPAAVGLFLLAGPTLATLFNYGRFSGHDVLMSQQSLWAFSSGIPAFMLIKVLASGYYAQQDIKTPVKIGVIALITNTILNFILIIPLKHAGLALSTSIAAWLNAGLLFAGLIRRGVYKPRQGWLAFSLRQLICNVVMILFLYFASNTIHQWLTWHWSTRFSHLLFLIIFAIIIYFIVLFGVGMRKIHLRHFQDGSA